MTSEDRTPTKDEEFDRSDPLIAALSTLADGVRPPDISMASILDRHAVQLEHLRRRRSVVSAVVAAAACISLLALVVTFRDVESDETEVRAVEPQTYSSLPNAPEGLETQVAERVVDGEVFQVSVMGSLGVTDEVDLRAGPFGPFGADRIYHRPRECLPTAPPDRQFTVSSEGTGTFVELYGPDVELPSVIDTNLFVRYTRLIYTDVATYSPMVLVFTDRSPLTYEATFSDGSVDRVTSNDPVVPLLGAALLQTADGDIPNRATGPATVRAFDEGGELVWEREAVSRWPWLTQEGCNGSTADAVGTPAGEDVIAGARAALGTTLTAGETDLDLTLSVADSNEEFSVGINELRAEFLDEEDTFEVVDVRLTPEDETWAFVESSSQFIGKRWLQLVATPEGWRTTRQSVCAIIPFVEPVEGCADVIAVFDSNDPT